MNKSELERLVSIEQRSKSNSKRLDEHDKKLGELSDMYVALTKVDNKVENVKQDVSEIKQDIKDIKEKPSKRLDQIIGYILAALISGLIGFILIRLGMK